MINLFCMLVSGYVWAWIVGSVVNLIDLQECEEKQHRIETDHLNEMMARQNIPSGLQASILRYNRKAKQNRLQLKEHTALTEKISKGLERRVARRSHEYSRFAKQ